MVFSGREYWSGLHPLLPGIFPTQGSNSGLLHYRWILYGLSHQGNQEYVCKSTPSYGWSSCPSVDCTNWNFLFCPFHLPAAFSLLAWESPSPYQHLCLLSPLLLTIILGCAVLCLAAQSYPTLCDPRQEYWSGLSHPPPGNLPKPGIKPRSPTLQEDS